MKKDWSICIMPLRKLLFHSGKQKVMLQKNNLKLFLIILCIVFLIC